MVRRSGRSNIPADMLIRPVIRDTFLEGDLVVVSHFNGCVSYEEAYFTTPSQTPRAEDAIKHPMSGHSAGAVS